jgi:outer membrane receptor protein involved in Fe transport
MTKSRHCFGLLGTAILSIALGLSPAMVRAQSTTQGSIAGTLEDPSGAVVGGASVSILNTATGFKVTLTTDANGYFKAPLLEPGTYAVSISASGFAGYKTGNVTVQVGQVTSLLPHLALASSASVVEVVDSTPAINTESPDFTATLNTQAMQNIPMNNRRWSSLAMLTPGVVSNGDGYGLISVRGISPLLNNVLIDGADDNQAFFSEERGRTREAYSTSGNAVREFAVNTGVYSAQYGRAAGGVITSVTKSGTNQLHGAAYFFDRQSNWNAYNNYTTLTSYANGTTTTSPIKPKDLRKIYGFTVGGALIKDKLFWIYTYDQHSHIFPVVGVPSNPQYFYTLPQSSLSTGETCNTTTGALSGAPTAAINDAAACALAARQGVSYVQAAYDWAAMIYGSANISINNYSGASAISDLGLNSDIGSVSRTGYQEINTPKIDWQINQKHHLSVLEHRLRWDSPGGVQTAPSDQYARDAQGNDFVKIDYGVAKLTSLISNNISNEALFQYSRELDYETQQAYTDYTKANFTDSVGGVPYLSTSSKYGFNAGSPYYSHRAAYPDERKWQIGDILYLAKGRHSLKVGVDVVHNYDLMNAIYQSNGSYSYQHFGNLFNDLLNKKNGITPSAANQRGCDTGSALNYAGLAKGVTSVVGPYPCYSSFAQGFGDATYDIATLDFGVFVQDNWKFSPRLTLELGLRWDHETKPGPDANLTTATGTFVPYNGLTNNPNDKTDFGPRVGFSYDVYGGGKTVLRGGYGIYFGRITNGNIENILLNTGSPNGQYTRTWKSTWSATNSGGPVFPNVYSTASMATCTAGTSACPSSYFMSPDLKLPEVQEFDLQLQQELGHGHVFAISYLGSLGRRLPNFLNVNLNPNTMTTLTVTTAADPNGKGPLGATGSTYSVPVYTSYGNTALLGANAANFSSITEFISNVNSSYNALTVELLNRSAKSFSYDVNYTWSHALDFAQNANTQGTANSWYNPYSNARANYGNSNFNVPQRFVAYVLYNFPNLNTKNPLKWLVNDWSINDSFQMQNGLPFTAGVSNYFTGTISSYWNGAGGLSVLPQVGYNTYKYPRRIVDDARLQKQIRFSDGRNLQLMLNAFNVANHQNITGYKGTYLYYLSGTTANYEGTDGTYDKNFKVVNNSNSSSFLYTPRQIEISARFNF